MLPNDDDAVEYHREQPTSHRRLALYLEMDPSFDEIAKKNRHLLVLLSEPQTIYVGPIVPLYILYIIFQADKDVIEWFFVLQLNASLNALSLATISLNSRLVYLVL